MTATETTGGQPAAAFQTEDFENWRNGPPASRWKHLRRELWHLLAWLHPVKRRQRTLWLTQDGVAFFRKLGIGAGDTVVDFGCGAGNYSVPAARAVGASGLVVAVDGNARALSRTMRSAGAGGLVNLRPGRRLSEVASCLDGRMCKAVLLFDMLHFMDAEGRQRIYRAFRDLLQPDGLLCVHPKHVRGDKPSWHFSRLSVDDVVSEIEAAGFRLKERKTGDMWHGHGTTQGVLLVFERTI
ncbi:MAG: methyltransferase domain-containing protein [Kiritimatiellae bacterium]|nr:methyltransferase domain-containing protein [Kiritimatiellia bacterium]